MSIAPSKAENEVIEAAGVSAIQRVDGSGVLLVFTEDSEPPVLDQHVVVTVEFSHEEWQQFQLSALQI